MAAFPEHFPNDGDLERYVRTLADLVGLRDWQIILGDESPGEGNLGSVDVTYGRRVATICLAEHSTIEDLRNTIVHELLHIHLEPIDWNNNNLHAALGMQVFEMWRGSYRDHLELAIDSIASAWDKSLPLPNDLHADRA